MQDKYLYDVNNLSNRQLMAALVSRLKSGQVWEDSSGDLMWSIVIYGCYVTNAFSVDAKHSACITTYNVFYDREPSSSLFDNTVEPTVEEWNMAIMQGKINAEYHLMPKEILKFIVDGYLESLDK